MAVTYGICQKCIGFFIKPWTPDQYGARMFGEVSLVLWNLLHVLLLIIWQRKSFVFPSTQALLIMMFKDYSSAFAFSLQLAAAWYEEKWPTNLKQWFWADFKNRIRRGHVWKADLYWRPKKFQPFICFKLTQMSKVFGLNKDNGILCSCLHFLMWF